MSTFVIYVSKYLWKRKKLKAHDSTGIILSVLVFTVSQMLSRTLDGLYFSATRMKMNVLNKFQKILEMGKFVSAKIFRR